MDCGQPGSSVHGILQARTLEWVAMPSSRDSFPGIEPGSPTLQVDSLLSDPPWKPRNTGVGSLFLLHRIFPTQELNQGLLRCRWILLPAELPGKPIASARITLMTPHCYVVNTTGLCFGCLFCGCEHDGSQFTHQGWNACPLQLKCRVPTTGPSGKSFGLAIVSAIITSTAPSLEPCLVHCSPSATVG